MDVNWQNCLLYLLIEVFSISSSPFDLIHSDVWGPSPVTTKGESQYYVFFFVDDHTCYYWIYLM